jgi:hypothetical protein
MYFFNMNSHALQFNRIKQANFLSQIFSSTKPEPNEFIIYYFKRLKIRE